MHIFPEYRVIFPGGYRERHLRHNRQLHDYEHGSDSRIFQRSIFGLVNAYNLLPQSVVDLKSTHLFQHHLQRALKAAATIDGFAWETLLSVGVRRMSVSRFRELLKKMFLIRYAYCVVSSFPRFLCIWSFFFIIDLCICA